MSPPYEVHYFDDDKIVMVTKCVLSKGDETAQNPRAIFACVEAESIILLLEKSTASWMKTNARMISKMIEN